MAEGQLVESNPASAPAAAPTGQADMGMPGTLESQNGQASPQEQSAPASDSFSSIDPNTLSPEMQAVYKSLQADYTRKTQSIAEARKKSDAFDQIQKDPRFTDYWQGLNRQQKADFKEQKQEAEKTLGEKISDEDFAKAFNSKDDFLSLLERVVTDRSAKAQKKIGELEDKLSVKDAADFVESYATEVDKGSGKPLRPDFYQLEEDGLITGYLQVNAPEDRSSEAYSAKLNEAYAWAKSMSQKYYERGKAEALKIIQAKAAAGSAPPTVPAKGAYSGPAPKNLTVREAVELAKKGIRVPQD